jgi:hypothetical protein
MNTEVKVTAEQARRPIRWKLAVKVHGRVVAYLDAELRCGRVVPDGLYIDEDYQNEGVDKLLYEAFNNLQQKVSQ